MMHRKVFIDGVSVALQRDDLESRHTLKGLEDLPYLAPTTAEGKVGVKQPTNIKGPEDRNHSPLHPIMSGEPTLFSPDRHRR